MSHFTDLRVFQEARCNIRSIANLCEQTQGFGDICSQMKRAAVSVVSNIAEGEQVKLHRNFRRVLEDSSARGAQVQPRRP